MSVVLSGDGEAGGVTEDGRKLRVLLLHDYGTLNGGAEYMSVMLRDRLRDRGHTAELLTTNAKPLDLPIVADHTCFGTTSPGRRLLQVFNPWAVRALRKALLAFRPDVVQVRMFWTQLSPAILPLLREVPSVLHLANYNLIHPLGYTDPAEGVPWIGAVRYKVQRWMWDRHGERAFDAILSNSGWVAERTRQAGIRVDRVVWNGCPARDARPALGETPRAAFVGRLFAKKGVDVLLRAWVAVSRSLRGAVLDVVGDGPELAALRGLADELGLGDSVVFHGHLPRAEMEAAANAAWVQVVPSVWEEPFGIVTAEAMMRGTAVVVSAHGGPVELVEASGVGRAYPPRDTGALSAALLELLRDREKCEAQGAAARAWALPRLSEQRYVDEMLGVYRGLLDGREVAS